MAITLRVDGRSEAGRTPGGRWRDRRVVQGHMFWDVRWPSASVFREAATGIATVCWLAPVGDRDLGRTDRLVVEQHD
jgi:hypothetical protein